MPKTWQGKAALLLTLIFAGSVAYGAYLQRHDDQLTQRVMDTPGAFDLLADTNTYCRNNMETYVWACGASVRITHGDTSYTRACSAPDAPRFTGTLPGLGTWDYTELMATPMTNLGDCDTGDNCVSLTLRGGLDHAQTWEETPPKTLPAAFAFPDDTSSQNFAETSPPVWTQINGQPVSLRMIKNGSDPDAVGPPYSLWFRTQHPSLPIGMQLGFYVNPDRPTDWQSVLQGALDVFSVQVTPPPAGATCPAPPKDAHFALDPLEGRQTAIDLANWLAAQSR